MDLSEAREKYIFKTHIELEDGDYIVLREPTSLEMKDFGDDGKANVELLIKIFPKAIVEHSFTDGGQPASVNKVAALLLDSGSQFTEIISTWMESLPLKKTKDGK